ncbi:MAG TPA: hypothetical protein VFZ04_09520 [Longimicrobiales bacterium]
MLPKNIPEERVPAILARAAELDRQTISIDALRSAALEAGISASAFEEALAEYARAADVSRPAMREVVAEPPRRNWRYWLRRVAEPLKLGALAWFIGVLGTRDVTMATVAVCWLIGTAGYLAWRDRGRGNAGRYQVTTLVMSALMFIGMAGVGGDQAALAYVLTITIALLILGSLIVHVGDEREDKVGDAITS